MQDGLAMDQASGEGSSGAKNTKQAHNEKERLRRMNLNASYSTLCHLLPNSKRSKKRWSAPKIIDRALTYIPELQNEIERLTLEKEQRTLKKEADKNHNNNVAAAADSTSSLTITQVAKGEFIIQVCAKGGVLSGLMRKVEDRGMSVKSASRVEISDDRICYHLHIEIDAEPCDKDYIAVLRDQLASWLD
ncbi:hypothetical protein QQ045_010548 [Rhodiola kirilowii]